MRWWVILAVTSCYRPSEIASCNVACGPNLECPDGMRCGTDRRCTGDSEDCSVLHPDAQTGSDGVAQTCWGGNGGATLGTVCPTTPPSGSLILGSMTIDTNLCTTDTGISGETISVGKNGMVACVFEAAGITLTGTVSAHGQFPLVLLATNTLAINAGGKLLLKGLIGQPAPNAGACANSGPGGSDIYGGGGGAGGSYGTYGAAGGTSMESAGHTNMPLFSGDTLAGGCNGTDGGAGYMTGVSPGGGGGGAVWLVGMTIDVGGGIDASGQGGHGGAPPPGAGVSGEVGAGGGGGGAGGLIALDASVVVVTGTIIANGGGGGGAAGGYNVNNNVSGEDGQDPDLSNPFGAARGGSPTVVGTPGIGGTGAADSLAAMPGDIGKSAGGGGGGLGIIELLTVNPTTTGAAMSPSPIVPQ